MSTYSGVYNIKNVETGAYMAMTSTGTKTSIVCSGAKGDKEALWSLVATRGKYKLRNLEHKLEAHTGNDFTLVGEPNGHLWIIRDGKGDERIIDTGSYNVVLEAVKTTQKTQLKVDKAQNNQRWIFEQAKEPEEVPKPQPPPPTKCPIAPGVYVLKNVKTETVMDLEHSKEGAGIKIFGFQANGGTNQKWNIQPGSMAPNVTICSEATKAYAAYSAFEQGATLLSNAEPHEYVITEADKGFHISPVQKPGYVVDMSGAGAANETEICLWVQHGGDHQKWYFEAA